MDAPRDPARQETEPRRDATDLAAATTVPLAGPLGAGHASPLAGAPPPGRIGGHDLLDRIAQGGMGVVYRARQVGLERVVALKVLRAGTDADEGETARFRQEARNAARLQHPNIVRVLDCGEEEGRLWFTMDYIEGRSLAKGIATERITPVRAARLALPLAEALAYAHAQGVIHRDVKPANVLLDAADEPHLADFGIARDVRAGSRLTLTGTVMGTPAYMPPEQARGDTGAVGPRSDVYALGATLFECLCLRPPFEGGSPGEVLSRVLREDPARVRRLAPQVPRDLALIVETAMAKDPARRYAGAAEMAADLRRFLAREPVLARAPSLAYRTWRHARRNPWAAALAALLLAAAAGVVAARELTMRRLLREGWDERSRWVQALHERNDARDALGAIEEETPPGLPLAQKGELLQARRALRDAEGRLFEHFYGGLDAFGAVLGLDADRPEALRGLAELYVDYLRAAEEDGDEWGVLEASAYVRHYDPEGRHVRLDSPVPVRVASDPPGAAVWLYRYEPDRDHLRLLPLPCGPSGRLASAADSPPIPPTPETDDLRGPD
ncbi:MAG: serine/threonine protein kinase, partial [Planctomycetes bacterium]|nr:serine/threonine protein kinase [Planctomycetota bacterium]